MPLDDFDLSPDMLAPPLDIGVGTPPFVPPQKSGGFNAKEFAPLLALMPLAAKGGPGAVGALMRGLQRARMQRQQQGRLDAQGARQDASQASMDQYRQAQMQQQQVQQQAQAKNAELQRRQQFMGQFNTALGGVDDPEAVKALIDFYGGQAQDFGVDRPALEQFAMQTATPDRLTSRKVSKRWEKMGVEARELAQTTKASLQIDGQTIPYQTWAPLVGGMVDPTTGAYPQAPVAAKPVTPPTAGSFEEYVGLPADQQALRRQQRKEFQQADDRPVAGPDPVLQEMRQLRLDQAKAGAAAPQALPPALARRVDSRARGWDALPIVKTTQKMAEAVTFANSLDVNTKNASDDQALIYAFAKAMDPDSVVREGEYATVQKYAQSWANAFGFTVARIFSNTPFLTPRARQNMKQTIASKYAAGKAQYDNVRKSYASQINRITGQADGEDYLTDYGGGFPGGTAPAGTTRVGRFEISVAP